MYNMLVTIKSVQPLQTQVCKEQ